MATKNSVKVFIAGKLITLAGYEEEEYLQKIASYLNHKIASLNDIGGYNRMPQDQKSALLNLNIADDYFKAKAQAEELENQLEEREHTAYEVRQDLVSSTIEVENLQKEIESLKKTVDRQKNDIDNLRNRSGYRR